MADVTAQIRSAAGQAVPLVEGAVRVVALCDGFAGIQSDRFPTLEPEAARALAAKGGVALDDMAVSVNCFLVETGGRRCLVDAGNGRIRGPNLGHLPQALAAAGCDPEDVDVLLITHMHGDHCVGLYDDDGRAAFPHATLIAAAAEWRFWQEAEDLNEMQQSQVGFARSAFAAYQGRTLLRSPRDEVLPGIRMVALPGHTPGHVGWLIAASGLLLWGDVAHVPALQMPRPEWYFRFDVDPAAAIATRRQVLARAVDDDLIVAGAHLPFPGAGRIRRAGDAFAYVPVGESSRSSSR
jgi:glyoxylase-like metal-dependent hydrolase (beta-lactamase superfamily II)